ncbi:MAG TPA: AMP-binding protein, partial [Rhizobiaceae bacterium]|nr:AMP-binding protein [Rhizobiaceae bacterium]
ADTLHVLDPRVKGDWFVETARGLTRSVYFEAEHMISSRRLLKHLKGGGRLAVYLPDIVEPDRQAFRLHRAVAMLARRSGAMLCPVFVYNSRHLSSSFTPAEMAPRKRFPALRVTCEPPRTLERWMQAGEIAHTPANAVFDMMALARMRGAPVKGGLHGALVAAAGRYGPGRVILEDTVTGTLTYKRLLIGARVLGQRFATMADRGEAVGVLLPNANGVIATLFALQSAARVAAMLNYTAGPASIVSAIGTARIRTVLSSRAFIEKAQLEDVAKAVIEAGANIVWLEDLRESLAWWEKLVGALMWRRAVRLSATGDAAVILFTSGSEGTPKGVVLSHANVISNAAQAEARVAISTQDTLFNVLPVFHSFGLTGGAILPLLSGVRLFLYPSPLHYKIIPSVAAKVKPTIMFGTDTFLAGYARPARDKDFESLRFVVAGAEAVKPESRHTWRDRFGADILEGYGMTEAAPVVAVNSSAHSRDMTVGRLLPGIQFRLEPVEGIEGAGRMWVKGPNVMLGYMTADRPGELQLLADGWHDSGDIVAIDREGYVAIRGRAKR